MGGPLPDRARAVAGGHRGFLLTGALLLGIGGDRVATTPLASVEDPEVASKILTHLGLPIRAPLVPPPWRPRAPQGRPDHDGIDPPSLFQ